MPLNTLNAAPLLTPEQVQATIVRPVTTGSVATQVSTVVTSTSKSTRFPLVVSDPTAAGVAEGQEIPFSSLGTDAVTVVPFKLAVLDSITREAIEDSDDAALDLTAARMAEAIAKRLDAGFFSAAAAGVVQAGIGAVAGVSTVDAGETWSSVDPFVDALAEAEGVGATVDAFVANPADARALAKLKQATGSNLPLFSGDPTVPTRRVVLGVPLFVTPAVPAGTVWGIPRARSFVVIRDEVRVETDGSPLFTKDSVAVRTTMRVGYAWPHAAAVVKVALSS